MNRTPSAVQTEEPDVTEQTPAQEFAADPTYGAARGAGQKMCACGHSIVRHQRCGSWCGAQGCHDCFCDIRAFEVDQGVLQYPADDPSYLKITLADRVEQLLRQAPAATEHTCRGLTPRP